MNPAWCLLAVSLVCLGDEMLADPVNGLALGMEIRPVSLREALRIALECSDFARVTYEGDRNVAVSNCFGGDPTEDDERRERLRSKPRFGNDLSIVVEPVEADASVDEFKRQASALASSLEEAYWNLAPTPLVGRLPMLSIWVAVISRLSKETGRCFAGRPTATSRR